MNTNTRGGEMGQFILVRDDGKYVTRPGSGKSYTSKLQEARIFRTREEAERDRCVDNERTSTVDSVIGNAR